jgi:hypothetical protein
LTNVSEYADKIMAEIHGDMQKPFPWGKQIPRDVGSFSALHDYCDANEYVLEAMGQLALNFNSDGDNALVNAVMDEVDSRLRAEAMQLLREKLDALVLASPQPKRCGCSVSIGGYRHPHLLSDHNLPESRKS